MQEWQKNTERRPGKGRLTEELSNISHSVSPKALRAAQLPLLQNMCTQQLRQLHGHLWTRVWGEMHTLTHKEIVHAMYASIQANL